MDVGGLFLILTEILEGEKLPRTVVKDAVEDDLHAAGMGLPDKLEQHFIGGCPAPARGISGRFLGEGEIPRGIRAEMRVRMVERACIVFVKGGGLENRVQIQRGYPQVFEVVQAVDHPPEIPAISTVTVGPVHVSGQLFFPIRQGIPFHRPGKDAPFPADFFGHSAVVRGRIVFGVSVSEPLGKNLVPDRLFRPGGAWGIWAPGCRQGSESQDYGEEPAGHGGSAKKARVGWPAARRTAGIRSSSFFAVGQSGSP